MATRSAIRTAAAVCLAVVGGASTGCGRPATVTANASDPTPPSALWVQADVPGRPLVNVSLGGGPVAAGFGTSDEATVTASADDPDGGIRALRLLIRSRRPRPGSAALSSFQLANATASSASPGQPAPVSARVATTVSAATLAGGGWDGGVEIMAEAENFAGGVSRSPVLSLCIERTTLRVHVVPLSDDDGGHAPRVTRTQFADALQRANRVFCGTGIQFRFDSVNGWAPRNSTGMNRDQTIRVDGDALANAMPNRVVLLLRWGPDAANATGNGNAYPVPGIAPAPRNVTDVDQRYVALPSLYPATGMGYLTLQNGAFMAHELGHYLGLYHTFPGWDGLNPVFGTTPANANQADQRIVTYVRANGGTTDALDGDGLADTPPDPGVALYTAHAADPCTTRITASALVGGTRSTFTFVTDVANVMSYYNLCDTTTDPRPRDFSPDQVARMHLTLSRPPRNGLLSP